MKMLAVVRVRGNVGVRKEIEDTMQMLHLKTVNNCVVVPDTPSYLGMIKKIKDYVAWGEIDKEVFKWMLKKWGRKGRKRLEPDFDVDKFTEEFFSGKTTFKDYGINPVFRLHPPRKGYRSIKRPYPKGALGYWGEQINELIKRMI